MTEAKEIAAKLSVTQRRRLAGLKPLWAVDMPYIEATLIAKGLLAYRRQFWILGPKVVFLTPLGEAVRAAIVEERKE